MEQRKLERHQANSKREGCVRPAEESFVCRYHTIFAYSNLLRHRLHRGVRPMQKGEEDKIHQSI